MLANYSEGKLLWDACKTSLLYGNIRLSLLFSSNWFLSRPFCRLISLHWLFFFGLLVLIRGLLGIIQKWEWLFNPFWLDLAHLCQMNQDKLATVVRMRLKNIHIKAFGHFLRRNWECVSREPELAKFWEILTDVWIWSIFVDGSMTFFRRNWYLWWQASCKPPALRMKV